MNPLFSLFILALFIEDYIFREGKYWKMYLYAIGLYTLFYTFQHRSTFHSPNKKFNMAGYNQSFDPTIYAKVKFDLTKAREFMAKKEKETGKKISITLFWIKVVAEVFNNLPECNEIIRFGLKAKRTDVDMGILVNVGDGKDLANMTMRNIPNRTFAELSDELYREADVFKKEKNEEYNKTKSLIRILPTEEDII